MCECLDSPGQLATHPITATFRSLQTRKQYDHTRSMKPTSLERVTVTLPNDLVRDIDRLETNRSKFVAEAVRRELNRRRRVALRRSLQSPHPETAELSSLGLEQWTRSLPQEDAGALVGNGSGKAVRWVQGEGWAVEGD
jgi:hypothetical protein